ncbi:MAG TPA: phosphatidylserine synthase [Campylobacterales bacterium]|nr:phosphatidylserine synthase [Campylobacterales bacterium]
MFLYDKDNHFNLANLVTFTNISLGIIAMYFIQQGEFKTAIILAWLAGAMDIIDGKIARKYNLSCEFGVQIDSYADFISFVIMPSFLLFYVITKANGIELFVSGVVFIYYIISGLRRLIEFNITSEAGEVAKHFVGIPTPLGAILLWVLYLLYSYLVVTNIFIILALVAIIAYLLNSKVKIPHP